MNPDAVLHQEEPVLLDGIQEVSHQQEPPLQNNIAETAPQPSN